MTRFAATVVAVFAACASPALAATTASLFDDAVKLELPAGFSALSKAELDKKFAKTARPPAAAFGDASRDTTIAFSLSDQKGGFTASQLPDYLSAMEQILPRVLPGIAWQKKELVTINGRPWAHLRFSASAAEGEMANDTWFTAFRGNILSVNLGASAAKWTTVESSLAAAFETIRIVDDAVRK